MVSFSRQLSGIALTLLAFTASAYSGGEDDLRGAVPKVLRADLMHERWSAALEKLDALRTSQPLDADLWAYLSAVAQDRAGQDENMIFEQQEAAAYFSNVMGMNSAIQGKRGGKLREMIQRDRKGVQVLSVK